MEKENKRSGYNSLNMYTLLYKHQGRQNRTAMAVPLFRAKASHMSSSLSIVQLYYAGMIVPIQKYPQILKYYECDSTINFCPCADAREHAPSITYE